MLFHKTHALCDIAVIRNYYRTVIDIQPRIVQEMNGKIDIRSLLFCPYDIHQPSPVAGVRKQRLNLMRQKMPEISFDLRAMMPQCAQIGILAPWLGWVIRARRNARREVFDFADIMVGLQYVTKQTGEIEPFERRLLQRAVVEVESIDVDISPHVFP